MSKSKSSGRSIEHKPLRSNTSFARRPGQRPSRQCLLIVCEGLQTEPIYFKSLRQELKLTLVEVEVFGQGGAPISVVEGALKMRQERAQQTKLAQKQGQQFNTPPFDEVWCVFDVENPNQNPSFNRAISQANSNNIKLAVSNPAFEYWYLLHFKETSKPFGNASELIQILKDKDCLPNYQKNLNMFKDLFPYTDIAIERAGRLFASYPDIGNDFPNPSTLVYKLVKKLKDMAHL